MISNFIFHSFYLHIYSINPRILEYKNNLTAEDLQQQVLYQLHFLRI